MSFREKIEWATLASLTGGFGWYFFALYRATKAAGEPLEHGPGMLVNMGLLVVAVVIITVIMVATSIFFAVRTPDDANARADEREKTISLRATRFAYFLLLIGTLSIFAAAHIGHGLFFILNLLLAVIVLAEIGRVASGLWLYRRG
jgi:hypothetical protein